jgi:D-alanine-D-alanine ligase
MAERVTVLMGGVSAEREVSLVSGAQCAQALRDAGYTVSEIDVTADIAALVDALIPETGPRPDVVFNALHGRYGEDGNIQGLLNLLGIPYTHSGVLASALAMDKQAAKRIFATAGLPVAEGRVVARSALSEGDPMARPYVVKPVNEGSSVGVLIVRPGDNQVLPDDLAVLPDTLLVERYVPGRELTVAVMGADGDDLRALGVTELRIEGGFYDYNAKYVAGRTEHLVPAPIVDSVSRDAMSHAITAHRVLGCRGVSRADFRYDDTAGEPGELVLLEVNTQPGMTPLSLVPEQARHCGIEFPELVTWMVEQARCD